jgi:hypothetical protein
MDDQGQAKRGPNPGEALIVCRGLGTWFGTCFLPLFLSSKLKSFHFPLSYNFSIIKINILASKWSILIASIPRLPHRIREIHPRLTPRNMPRNPVIRKQTRSSTRIPTITRTSLHSIAFPLTCQYTIIGITPLITASILRVSTSFNRAIGHACINPHIFLRWKRSAARAVDFYYGITAP